MEVKSVSIYTLPRPKNKNSGGDFFDLKGV